MLLLIYGQILSFAICVMTATLHDNLTSYLLSKVNHRLRPVLNPHDKFIVHVETALYQVVDLDQRNNLASISAYFDMWWHDFNMEWNPVDFGGSTETYLLSSDVWTPEIYLYHSVEGGSPLSIRDSAVWVNYEGKARVLVPFTARAFCPVNVKYFPFDVQQCTFTFGSWSYVADFLEYNVDNNEIFLDKFYDNQEWLLINSSVESAEEVYATKYHNDTYAVVNLKLQLQRQSFYYVFNLVIPVSLVCFVSVIGLHMPINSSVSAPRRENKFRLGIMTLLSMGVMLLMLVEEMPKFALNSIEGQRGSFSGVPLLGLYYISLITVVSVCTCTSGVFVVLERKGLTLRTKKSIPKIIRWLGCGCGNYHSCNQDEVDWISEMQEAKYKFSEQTVRCHPCSNRNEEQSGESESVMELRRKVEMICDDVNQQLKVNRRLMMRTTLPVHWEIVITRLENISLFLYISLVISLAVGFFFPFW